MNESVMRRGVYRGVGQTRICPPPTHRIFCILPKKLVLKFMHTLFMATSSFATSLFGQNSMVIGPTVSKVHLGNVFCSLGCLTFLLKNINTSIIQTTFLSTTVFEYCRFWDCGFWVMRILSMIQLMKYFCTLNL